METSSLTRRQRLREQTLEEIHTAALRQVAEGGPEAVSLNAIAKAIGMSGPGLYRYYASRDDLLAALVTAGYGRLAAALQDAARTADDLPADERLGRVVHAYRDWAVANPRYYQFLFGVRPGGARADSDEAVDVMHGGMRVLEDVFAALTAPHAPALPGDALGRQLRSWSGDRDDPRGTAVLRLAVSAWTRLHGVVGLELTGALARMGLDPRLLLDDEVRRLVGEAKGAGASQRAPASEEWTVAECRPSDVDSRPSGTEARDGS